jgi:hypothetical protein
MITSNDIQLAKATFEKLAGITEERHHALIYRQGLRRLKLIAKEHSGQFLKMERSAKYWQWFQRDYHTKNIAIMQELGINPFDPEQESNPLIKEALLEGWGFMHTAVKMPITFPAKCLVK